MSSLKVSSVISVWASVFALEITHAQLVVPLINVTAVFGSERPALTFFIFSLLCLKQNNNICFFLRTSKTIKER